MIKTEKQKSFSAILKSTMIFGSTQVFQMMIMLLRSKVSAVLLGPSGVGMNSIFQTSVITVGQFASLGIFQSGVREISQFNIAGEEGKLAKKVQVFSKLSNGLAILSFIIMIILAYPLSYFSFDSENHIVSFCFLAFGVLFYIFSQKQITIMQATMQTRNIALSSLTSASISLIVGWVLYKIYGGDGIVPAIILTFMFQYIVGYIFMRKIKNVEIIPIKKAFVEGKPMLGLGVVLMVSVLLINVFTLFLNGIISRYGNIQDLGFFYAAFAITNGNVLILISVLSSDYFPRLSACVDNKSETNSLVNNQAELMSLITGPITIFLIIFSGFIVKILLSKEFLIIIPMLKLMSIGLLFRIVWQSMSYVILSRGDRKTYLIYDALIGNGFVFITNVFFYFVFGLNGLGYSFVISSIVVAAVLTFIVQKKYNIYFQRDFIISFLLSLLFCLVVYSLSSIDSFFMSVIVLCLSAAFTVKIISKRLNINILQTIKNKLGQS